jgi:agmatine deiminase
LVANDSTKNEAQKWYTKWGIEANHNTFIIAPQGLDAWWTRDWGPSAVFTSDGKMKLGDGKYIYSTPASKMECGDSLQFLYLDETKKIIKTEVDDNATIPLGKGLHLEVLDLPFIATGGNVMTDGLGTAFSTCILLNENKFYNVSREDFFKLNEDLQGINNYHIISNFEEMGIQHIDCFMKLLDEERILVAEPPTDHKLYPVYENIVQNELKKLKTVYGRPYEILRLKTARYEGERLAAYTNSIIVNKTIYVPLFQIEEDKEALNIWQNAMPGYTVKGFEFALEDEQLVSKEMKEHYKTGYGWNNGDALHCRTRAIWDNEMLFISTKRIDKVVDTKHRNIVYTTIIDYSKIGLMKDKTQLFWRVQGDTNWESATLNSTKNPNHFNCEIPYHQKGSIVEYYISAESKSGRKETQPRTAPEGTYQFKIE